MLNPRQMKKAEQMMRVRVVEERVEGMGVVDIKGAAVIVVVL